MPSINIYIWNDGEYDYSRWISLGHRGPEVCVLHLTDVCQPGKLSQLSAVSCPSGYLKASVERGGSVQVTLPNGFLLVQRKAEVVYLEFRGAEDGSAVKATFKPEDFLTGIGLAGEDAGKVAVTV